MRSPYSADEVVELLGPAGGGGDAVAGLQRGADEGAAEAAGGTGDEPCLSAWS